MASKNPPVGWVLLDAGYTIRWRRGDPSRSPSVATSEISTGWPGHWTGSGAVVGMD